MKSVLITGCSSGIGLAAATEFKRRGYRVFASARKPADVQRLAELGFEALQMDLADPAAVEQAVSRMLERSGGHIAAVIHNAGFGLYGALEDLSRAAMEEQFQSNVFGVHQINRLLIPVMRAQGGGRIVIVTSVLGFVAARFRGLYVASKFALEGLADTLRLELAGSGIRVALVEPGPIETAFRSHAHAALLRHVDPEASVHRVAYRRFIAGLAAAKSTNRHVLPPEACLPALLDAVEAASPRLRYRITRPTQLLAVLKHLLPAGLLDRLLMKG